VSGDATGLQQLFGFVRGALAGPLRDRAIDTDAPFNDFPCNVLDYLALWNLHVRLTVLMHFSSHASPASSTAHRELRPR